MKSMKYSTHQNSLLSEGENMTNKQLIKILQNKNPDKEVVFECGFNHYFVETVEERKDDICFFGKIAYKKEVK